MINQPDPERHIRQVESMQDVSAKIGGVLQTLEAVTEQALLEYNADGITMETCEKSVRTHRELHRLVYDLSLRMGVNYGESWYFLPEGANEGDLPPCEC